MLSPSIFLRMLSALSFVTLSACQVEQAEQAPGYSAAAAANMREDEEVYAPNKDFESVAEPAEDAPLFLADSKAPARLNAVGTNGEQNGYYKLTTQGYQYYNAADKPTSWFGQKNDAGGWAMTQGNYSTTNKTYGFAGQPTLDLQKQKASNTWSGSWKQYDASKKTYTPAGTQHQVNFMGAKQGGGWSTQIKEPSGARTLRYNSWLPTGQAQMYVNGDKQGLWDTAPRMNIQGTAVPSWDKMNSGFGQFGDFWRRNQYGLRSLD